MQSLTTLDVALDNLIEQVSARVEQGGVSIIGLPTGFHKLDETTGGLRKGNVYLIASRPAMGKSSMALSVSAYAARNKQQTLLVSLEMSAELLALRFLSGQTGISAMNIEYGRLTKDELKEVQKAREEAKSLTFHLFDGSIDSPSLLEQVQKHQEANGLDLLTVDYVSLLRDSGRFGENERVSRISSNLHEIARTCDIPVLVLAQLNREVEKRENHMPILSDIRDSGSLEQDAAVVMFVYRPHYYAMLHEGEAPVEVESDAKIIIAKNRFGPVGQLTCEFIPKQMLWRSEAPVPTPPPSTQAGSLVAKVKEKKA